VPWPAQLGEVGFGLPPYSFANFQPATGREIDDGENRKSYLVEGVKPSGEDYWIYHRADSKGLDAAKTSLGKLVWGRIKLVQILEVVEIKNP